MGFCLAKGMNSAMLAVQHDRSCYSGCDGAFRVYLHLELDFCFMHEFNSTI